MLSTEGLTGASTDAWVSDSSASAVSSILVPEFNCPYTKGKIKKPHEDRLLLICDRW